MVNRYDFIEIKAEVTPEGWIRDKPVVTRSGIFEYRQPNGKVTREFRSDDMTFEAASLQSLSGIPITVGHNGMASVSKADDIIGSVLTPGSRQDSNVVTDIIIHNAPKVGKRRELSLGYTCDIKETPGEFNGQRYDCEQINVRYNHLAVVQKGRAGNARLRLDSSDAVSGQFEQEDDMPGPEGTFVAVRLDGIDYRASPEVANKITKLEADMGALQKRFDTLEAERDGLKVKVTTAEAAVVTAREQREDEVRTRVGLEAKATELKVGFKKEDTTRALQENILKVMSPSIRLDGKSDDYVAAAYEVALEADLDKKKKGSEQTGKFQQRADEKKDAPTAGSSGDARARYLARLRGEKVADKAA